MIRLIATDLDGTLLEPDGSMPEGVFEAIRNLDALGIRFVAASGRQLGNLKRLFAPVAERMDFICENGAINVADGEAIGVIPIPRETGLEIITDIEALGMDVLLSGRHTCYVTAENRAFSDDITYRLRNTVTVVDDLRAVPEDFLKISGHAKEGVNKAAPELLKKWGKRLTATVAGWDWFDFTVSDKGKGLRMLLERRALAREETMAFGDNFNDESMLSLVGHPYVMEHADAALKKPGFRICRKVVPILQEIVKANGCLP